MPSRLIIEEYDDDLVNRIIDLQKVRRRERGLNTQVFLIFDDMASDASIRYQSTFRRLAMEGRHAHITTIFLTQHYTSASTQIRSNASWDVLFVSTFERALKGQQEELANDFATPEDFRAFLARNTKDHGVVIVSQDPQRVGPKRYWTFTASEPPPYCLLCDNAWGGPRMKLWAKQRKDWRMPPQYKESTLAKMLYKETNKITREQLQGRTDKARQNNDANPLGMIQ